MSNFVNDLPKIHHDKIPAFIGRAEAAGANGVVFESSPGIAKSAMVEQYAKSIGAAFFMKSMAGTEPTEIFGFPYPNKKTGRFEILPNGEFIDLIEKNKKIVILLDEFEKAPLYVQGMMGTLIHDNWLGAYRVPDDRILWVLCVNKTTDNSGSEVLARNIANRLTCAEVIPNVSALLKYASTVQEKGNPNGWHPVVLAFLKSKPELVHDWDSERLVNCSFRTWRDASAYFNTIPPGRERDLSLRGSIGDVTTALVEYERVLNTLPKVELITTNPDAVDVPTEMSHQYFIATVVSRAMTEANSDTVMRYVRRLPKEFQVLVVSAAKDRDPKVYRSQSVQDFYLELANDIL